MEVGDIDGEEVDGEEVGGMEVGDIVGGLFSPISQPRSKWMCTS